MACLFACWGAPRVPLLLPCFLPKILSRSRLENTPCGLGDLRVWSWFLLVLGQLQTSHPDPNAWPLGVSLFLNHIWGILGSCFLLNRSGDSLGGERRRLGAAPSGSFLQRPKWPLAGSLPEFFWLPGVPSGSVEARWRCARLGPRQESASPAPSPPAPQLRDASLLPTGFGMSRAFLSQSMLRPQFPHLLLSREVGSPTLPSGRLGNSAPAPSAPRSEGRSRFELSRRAP